MNTEQHIQKYIANQLSEADKQEFENKLMSDPDFKLAYEEHQDIVMAYRLFEAETLKTKFQELEEKEYKQENAKFSMSKLWYVAVASVLIIGFFYTTKQSNSAGDLYNSNFSVYPNTYLPVTRGNNDNTSLQAFVAYENKDFEVAEKAFESILEKNENPNIRFYYALSLLNQDKFNLALAQLNQLDVDSSDYKPEILWYSSLIYLHQENVENAKKQLKKLNSLKTKFKSEETKQLLKDLEKV
jgi:tetratricopeptide (TPR) repeat protein